MKYLSIIFAFFIHIPCCCSAEPLGTPLPTFNYQSFELENGLQVVIIPNHRVPVVYHSLWYKVGSADSPLHKTGLAHFLEHLMYQGTGKFPHDTYKRVINNLGGEQNANTSWDRTLYYILIAKEHLPLIMEMEADRMQNLSFTDEVVEKEKEVVLQERRSTIDARPESRLAEAANASFFWQHPYGSPVIGFEEHIRQYTKTDASDFYKKWYMPNNAILVIAGDVKFEEVKPLIQRYYGALKAGTAPKRNRLIEPDHRGASAKVELKDPQFGGMYFEKIYKMPNFKLAGPKEEGALTLLQDILGDNTFGRLNHTLVENQKIAHFANATYTGYMVDPYSFTIMAAPTNSTDLSLLEASIEAEIRRIISDGVTMDEMENAKRQWLYDLQYRKDSLLGLANYFGENLSTGYTFKDLENWLKTITEVNEREIQSVAKKYLSQNPAVTAYAYPVIEK